MEPVKQKIFDKVGECLTAALGVDRDEIKMESSLTRDLGAESIDFLDIVFRLEKAFGVKIPRGDLFPENVLSNPEFVKDGKVTPQGMVELKKRLPHTNFSDFEKEPLVSRLADTFTVKMIVEYLAGRETERV
ncbi:MAG: acyl carrier protein [Candidatus Omnitrophica bacterium]|nr:acyl carrier protein [Candidatus Omnitrophota bacterium]